MGKPLLGLILINRIRASHGSCNHPDGLSPRKRKSDESVIIGINKSAQVSEVVKNEVDMQETFELPTEVWAGNSVKRLFEYVSTQHPNAKLPGPDPKSYDTSAQTSDYVERYMKMALWEKMELRGAMLMIMSHFIREAKPRLWTSDERMKRVLKHIHEHIADEIDLTELASTTESR